MRRIESRITWCARRSGGLIAGVALHFPVRIVGTTKQGEAESYSSIGFALHCLVFSWRLYFNYGRAIETFDNNPSPTYRDWYRLKGHVPRVVTDNGCYLCEELRVVGPDHRNAAAAEHDEGCPNKL